VENFSENHKYFGSTSSTCDSVESVVLLTCFFMPECIF